MYVLHIKMDKPEIKPVSYMETRWKIRHLEGKIIRAAVSAFVRKSYNDPFRDGIVAQVITRDDIWLYEAIASTKNFVDEYIIVDSSNNLFAEYNKLILTRLLDGKYTYIRKDVDQRTARQIIHKMAKRKWLLRLDGDMIAVDRGFNSAENLFKIIRQLNDYKFHDIYFPLLFVGDSLKYLQNPPYGYEDWIYSNFNSFRWSNRKLDLPDIPLRFKKTLIDIPFFIHLNHLFPDFKYYEKYASPKWQTKENQDKYRTFENFVEHLRSDARTFKRPDNYIKYSHTFGYLPTIVDRFVGMSREEILAIKMREIKDKIIPE